MDHFWIGCKRNFPPFRYQSLSTEGKRYLKEKEKIRSI